MTWELSDQFGSANRVPTKHEWNRLGYKKLEDDQVDGRRRREPVAVWFNKQSNEFAAHFLGLIFEKPTYAELMAAMKKYLENFEEMPFARWLEISYDRSRESERYGIGGRSYGGRDDEDESRPVSGIRLEFDVYDVSPTYTTMWRSGKESVRVWRRMVRSGDEWTCSVEEVRIASFDTKQMIPFTDERYATLVELKRALADLDARLNMFLGDGVKDRGALLDRIGQSLLMAPRLAAAIAGADARGADDEEEEALNAVTDVRILQALRRSGGRLRRPVRRTGDVGAGRRRRRCAHPSVDPRL